jgi:UDP-N-acetylmuramoyl-L-alanyl-D-glutamate--2,6-diaminopimelate ligase
MKEKNVEYIVLEASSHALDQKKLLGTHIDIGIFTNLSSEHMDYHGDIESYFKAKEELFKICNCGIINIDDKYGKIMFGSENWGDYIVESEITETTTRMSEST